MMVTLSAQKRHKTVVRLTEYITYNRIVPKLHRCKTDTEDIGQQ